MKDLIKTLYQKFHHLILYGIITETSIGSLFAAGILKVVSHLSTSGIWIMVLLE